MDTEGLHHLTEYEERHEVDRHVRLPEVGLPLRVDSQLWRFPDASSLSACEDSALMWPCPSDSPAKCLARHRDECLRDAAQFQAVLDLIGEQ